MCIENSQKLIIVGGGGINAEKIGRNRKKEGKREKEEKRGKLIILGEGAWNKMFLTVFKKTYQSYERRVRRGVRRGENTNKK